MKFYLLILATCFVFQCCGGHANLYGDERPPNIVILYSDDAGYADFGFQRFAADDVKKLTPQIDSIAKNGARFTSAYMSGCVCSPSRAGLMTGRYQQRFGHDNNLPVGYQGGLPLKETMMASRLRSIGYQTGLIGKWHLGYPQAYQPNQRGFDFFYGCLRGSRNYFPYEDPPPNVVFLENSTPTPEGGYTTDRIGHGACEFIRSVDAAKPFFLFVSFTATHGPLQPKAEHLKQLSERIKIRRRKNLGLLISLDENVGRILHCLEEQNFSENTMVIFTNDNGGQTRTAANNYPLRGGKGTLYEGGIRVPFALRWPGKVEPGTVVNEPIISLDLLPTFVRAANEEVEASWELDGQSFLHRITGETKVMAERTLFWRRHGKHGAIAARKGNWKLLHNRNEDGATPELYNVFENLEETTNVASSHPQIVDSLLNEINEWESELQDPLWGVNSPGYVPPEERSRNKRTKSPIK